MGRIFGIGLIVAGIWVGMEIYTQGTDRAFGGALAFLGKELPRAATPSREPDPSVLEGIRGRVENSFQRGEDRYRSQLRD